MVSQWPAALVGRDSDLVFVQRIVAGLGRGRGTTLLIEGEAGIGKTRLVEWMADEARSAGFTVLRGEGHPFERTRPFVGSRTPSASAGGPRILGAPRSPSCWRAMSSSQHPAAPSRIFATAWSRRSSTWWRKRAVSRPWCW